MVIGSYAVNRLLLGLVGAAFALISAADGRDRRARVILFSIVGAIPLAAWTIWPELFEVATVAVSLLIRRAGLVAGAAALLIRYQSARAHHKEDHGKDTQRVSIGWRYAALALLLLAVALGTANWLVTLAIAIAVVSAVLNLVVVSRRESASRDPGQPDS